MFINKQIDINCDVGEGIDNEHLLMPYISSCNIACGAHAGDLQTIDKVIGLAKKHKVKIGAHPSFPDKENFGRKIMNISNSALQKSVETQIQLVIQRAALQKIKIHHIKPHGALYNLAAKDSKIATIVLNAIENVIKEVSLYAPYNSVIAKEAEKRNMKVKYEAFIDRSYNEDASLVSRTLPNAIIEDKEVAFQQLVKIFKEEKVSTVQGKEILLKATTFCVHGDHKEAVALLKYLYLKIKES